MGTRCIIAAENHDGTVSAAICFLDGNPAEAGQKLLDHYTDPADVHALISLRSIYSMGNSPHHPVDHSVLTLPDNIDHIQSTLTNHCVILPHNIPVAEEFQNHTVKQLAQHLDNGEMHYAYVYGEGGWALLAPPDCRPQSLARYMEENAPSQGDRPQ